MQYQQTHTPNIPSPDFPQEPKDENDEAITVAKRMKPRIMGSLEKYKGTVLCILPSSRTPVNSKQSMDTGEGSTMQSIVH